MTDKINRRAVLAASGATAAAVLAAGPAVAHHDHYDDECKRPRCEKKKDEKKHHDCPRWEKDDTNVCTFPCHQPKKCQKKDDWWDSVLTVYNCSPCPRKLHFRSSGHTLLQQSLLDARLEDLPSSQEFLVQPGERHSIWFTGEIQRLDAEAGDMNIAITYRAETDAHYCE